jgi:hypothetical protein
MEMHNNLSYKESDYICRLIYNFLIIIKSLINLIKCKENIQKSFPKNRMIKSKLMKLLNFLMSELENSTELDTENSASPFRTKKDTKFH